MGQLLNKLIDLAVSRGHVSSGEVEATKSAIEALASKYGTTSDEIAKISLIETGGMNPKDNYYGSGGGCVGVWQACTFGGLPEISQTFESFKALSAAKQWTLFDKYLSVNKQRYPNIDFSDPVNLYLINLNPESSKIQGDTSNLKIPGKQASILYQNGIITRKSLREGMIKNAAQILGLTYDQVAALAPGTKNGTVNPNVNINQSKSLKPDSSNVISQAVNTLNSAIQSILLTGKNCPPPEWNQRDRIIYTGCKTLSATPLLGNSLGSGYAAPAINSLGSSNSNTTTTNPTDTSKAIPNNNKPYEGQLKPGGLIVPMKKGSYSISSEFGPRTPPKGGGSSVHKGIDMAAPIGTPIYAAADGVCIVSRIEGVSKDPEGYASGYGHVVYLKHAGGLITRYGHTSVEYVKEGDSVKQGQLIALSGTKYTGPHLHFEIRPNNVPENPRHFLTF